MNPAAYNRKYEYIYLKREKGAEYVKARVPAAEATAIDDQGMPIFTPAFYRTTKFQCSSNNILSLVLIDVVEDGH